MEGMREHGAGRASSSVRKGQPPGTQVAGVPTQVGGRHAFAHERVLVFIALETRLEGKVGCSKREIADMLGVNMRTIDRAVKRLRSTGDIESVACYADTGAQLGNEYRATPQGTERADDIIARAFAVKA